MKYQFRQTAREALARANAELAGGEDHRVRYAALELRLAMEALAYDRAQLYKEERPPSESSTWQPGKLIKVLIEIEPHANTNSRLRFKEEASQNTPEGDWHFLGEDVVIPTALKEFASWICPACSREIQVVYRVWAMPPACAGTQPQVPSKQ